MKVSVRDEKDLINNALDLLDSGNKWTKYEMRSGDRFCVLGALHHESGRNRVSHEVLVRKASDLISESIRRLFPNRISTVHVFNDCAYTKWEDVEAVLKDAKQ